MPCRSCGQLDRYPSGPCRPCHRIAQSKVSRRAAGVPCARCGSTEQYARGDCAPCARARYVKNSDKVLARLAAKRRAAGAAEHHGLSRGSTRVIYKAWQAIKDRCLNENCSFYDRYGGRGIRVHEPWIHDPVAFVTYVIATMGHRPSSRHSIDRINNEWHYEPGNIRWATYETQNRNRRRTKFTGKLSADDVATMRRWRTEGRSVKDVAAHFRVTTGCVHDIWARRRWADVS
jgi:hypothetical protein